MARTLGCLVVSMTTGAAFLHWVQPEPTKSRPPVSGIELIASMISQPWHAVRIEPARMEQGLSSRHAHFFVDREGRASIFDNWRSQSPVGQPGVIRIALQAAANTNEVTDRQWMATEQLVAKLLKECQIPGQNLSLSDNLAIPHPKSGSSS
ncbi:MAG: hypothetical protein AMXMBFR13_04700 [Phycisphaerae bacterium]